MEEGYLIDRAKQTQISPHVKLQLTKISDLFTTPNIPPTIRTFINFFLFDIPGDNMVDYGWSFSRAVEDWKKILIGAVIGLIPIVNLIYAGYLLRVAKTAHGKKKLPEWDQWVDDFVNGLKVLVVGIVYAIPLIIVAVIFVKSLLAGAVSTMMEMASEGGTSNLSDVSGLFDVGFTGVLVIFVLGLLIALLQPAAVLRMAFHGNSLGEAFKFGEVFRRVFTGEYIVTWIIVVIVTWIIGLIGSMLGGFIGAKTFILLGSFITSIFYVIIGFFGYSAFGQLKY